MSISEKLTTIAKNTKSMYVDIIDKFCPELDETGPIVACDPVPNYPLNVVSHITPVQAGSGDPYPPGGGKNLINLNNAVLRDYTTPLPVVDNGVVWKAGNSYFFYIMFDTPIPAETTVCCTWKSEKDSLGSYVRYCSLIDEEFYSISSTAGQGGLMSVTKPAYGICLSKDGGSNPLADDIVISDIQVEIGSAATEYAPYSNIRPITGHTGTTLWRGGKNLLKRPMEFNASAVPFEECFFLKAGTYHFHVKPRVEGVWRFYISLYYPDGTVDDTNNPSTDFGLYFASKRWGGLANNSIAKGKIVLTHDSYIAINYGNNETENLFTEAQLEIGSVGTEYEPYREFEEFTERWGGGKNLFDDVAFYEANGFTQQANDMWLGVHKNKTIFTNPEKTPGSFTMSYYGNVVTGTRPMTFLIEYTDGSIDYLGAMGSTQKTYTLTTDSAKTISCITWTFETGGEYLVKDVQIEFGSVATDYEPYQPSKLPANLGSHVYGGSYNWNTGKLVIDKQYITVDGNCVFSGNSAYDRTNSTNRFVTVPNTGFESYKLAKLKAWCDMLLVAEGTDVWLTDNAKTVNRFMLDSGTNLHINISNESLGISTEDDYDTRTNKFKSFCETHPLHFVLPLAEHITIQLTPQEIAVLAGTNTLYGDIGDTTVTGRSDPRAIIAKLEAALASAE